MKQMIFRNLYQVDDLKKRKRKTKTIKLKLQVYLSFMNLF